LKISGTAESLPPRGIKALVISPLKGGFSHEDSDLPPTEICRTEALLNKNKIVSIATVLKTFSF
jgi:hypothetical protein